MVYFIPMRSTTAIQIRLGDEELAKLDEARTAGRQTPLSRAAFGREAAINEAERRLRAIEALETAGNAAPLSRGGVNKPGASVARNGSRTRGRK